MLESDLKEVNWETEGRERGRKGGLLTWSRLLSGLRFQSCQYLEGLTEHPSQLSPRGVEGETLVHFLSRPLLKVYLVGGQRPQNSKLCSQKRAP